MPTDDGQPAPSRSGRVAVFGASGFLGRHIAAAFREGGWEVVGISRRGMPGESPSVHACDVADAAAVAGLLRRLEPAAIVDAIGAGHGLASWPDLVRVHVLGTAHVLAAAAALPVVPACVVVSSSARYGPGSEAPAREGDEPRPVTEYGLAKLLQENVAAFAARRTGTRVLTVRMFNLIGPGVPETLVPGRVARQIARIEQGAQPPVLETGNLDAERDFVDVRDAARALRAVAERGRRGETYNVCSGRPIRIATLVEKFLATARVRPISIRSAAGLFATDVPRQFGDYSRLARDTGWAPGVSLDESIAATLDHWRHLLSL